MTLTSASYVSFEGDPFSRRLRLDAINYRVARTVPLKDAQSLRLIPIDRTSDELVVAVTQVLKPDQLRRLERLAGCRIRQVRGTLHEIRAALGRVWGLPAGEATGYPDDERLGQWLVLLGALTDDELATGISRQRATGAQLGRALVQENLVDEDTLLEALGVRLNIPTVPIDRYRSPAGVAAIIDSALAYEGRILPISCDGAVLTVATPDPRIEALAAIEESSGYSIRLALCRDDLLDQAIREAFAHTQYRPVIRSETELLVEFGFADQSDLRFAREIRDRAGDALVDILKRTGRVDDAGLRRVAAGKYGLDVLGNSGGSPQGLHKGRDWLPSVLAHRHSAVIVGIDDEIVELAVSDPAGRSLEDWLRYVTGRDVRVFVADPETIARFHREIYGTRHFGTTPARTEIESFAAFLERDGFLTGAQVEEALHHQHAHQTDFPRAVIETGALDEDDILLALAVWISLPSIHLDHVRFDRALAATISKQDLLRHRMVPIRRFGRTVLLAVASPFDAGAVELVERTTSLPAQTVLAGEVDIVAAIERLFPADRIGDSGQLSRIGEKLISRRFVTARQWRSVTNWVAEGHPLDVALVSNSDRLPIDVARNLAGVFGLELADLAPRQTSERVVDALGLEVERRRWSDPVDSAVAARLPFDTARRFCALPFARQGDTLVVACANPADEGGLGTVAATIGASVRWVVSPRTEIDSAIERTLGRKNLGTHLLEHGIISHSDLARALDYQSSTGVRLGNALVTLGIIRPDQLSEFLAVQNDLISVDLTSLPIDPAIARTIPEEVAREHAVMPIASGPKTITLAMVDPLDEKAILAVEEATGLTVEPVLATESSISAVLQDLYRDEYLRLSSLDLVMRRPDESAMRVLSLPQKVSFVVLLALSAVAIWWNAIAYFIVLNGLVTAFYFAFSSYRFYLIYKALGHSLEVATSEQEIAALDDRDLPVYTILIPVYHEAAVIPRLVRGIDRLDYPKAKLDVKLLVEEDDQETIDAIVATDLPNHFKIVVVPHGLPKGKPKACNYGLIQAQGEYVVIYDAEDIPDPDQLKKVIVAFRKAEDDVACVQCKLNYYNGGQNLLTKWFTTEYSMWFDLFLPGLGNAKAPIPLGGTSNHFRADVLRSIGAWDPWNVTEDADIGIRLFKGGYSTAIVDSTTYEEANSAVGNWIRQRSRWVKGYIQTWLVHMRNPVKLLQELGPAGFLSFQFVIAGTFFGFLVNPIYWGLTALWFLTHAGFIQQIFPAPVFYLGAFALYVGNFAFAYINVAGCVRRRYYDLVKYAVISPLYWALMSLGAWKGLIQLFYKASYWEKTTHGLYQGPVEARISGDVRDLL